MSITTTSKLAQQVASIPSLRRRLSSPVFGGVETLMTIHATNWSVLKVKPGSVPSIA
jgi:hypothetical protein